jgi:transcriptional regulator with XRE-family HTH domain
LILVSVITKVKGMNVVCQDFRENVQAVLHQKGWSRKQLAEEMGVTPSYVTQLLNGYSEPGLAVVEDVAVALGVSISRLVEKNSPEAANGD